MTSSSPTARVAWIDTGKGLAIIAVVLYHSAMYSVKAGMAPHAWTLAASCIAGFSMPLFLFLSGLFARRAVAASWSDLLRRRILPLLWLYGVWSLLRFTVLSSLPHAGPDEQFTAAAFAHAVLLPTTSLWFLQALMLFLVVTKAMDGRVSVRHQLVASALLGIAVSAGTRFFLVPTVGLRSMAMYFALFLIGVHMRETVLRWTADARRPVAIMLAGFFAVEVAVIMTVGVFTIPGVATALGVTGLAGSALLARHLSPTRAGSALAILGRLSLPIYVGHVTVVAAAIALFRDLGLHGTAAAFVPPALALLGITTSLGLFLVAVRTSARYLYAMPEGAFVRRQVSAGMLSPGFAPGTPFAEARTEARAPAG